MGGCCSTHESNDAQTELATISIQPLPPHGRVQSSRGSSRRDDHQPLSEAAVGQFMRRAQEGFEVLILLANGLGIQCDLRVNVEGKVVRLTKFDLVKEIPFSSIDRVLSQPDELTKIKTEAKLDACCSALYSAADSSCIVFCFDTPELNQAFVAAAYRFVQKPKRAVVV